MNLHLVCMSLIYQTIREAPQTHTSLSPLGHQYHNLRLFVFSKRPPHLNPSLALHQEHHHHLRLSFHLQSS